MKHNRRIGRFFVGLTLLFSVEAVEARDLVVGEGEPYASPAAALAAVEDGDRILIREGLYTDSTLVVHKSIRIEGEPGAVLDGHGAGGILVIHAANVTVRGLILRNVGNSYIEDRAAIKVEDASDCLIEDNRIENTFFGIYLARTSGCIVQNNEVVGSAGRESKSGNGVHLWYTRDATIQANLVTGHRDGIYLEFVQGSAIEGNVSTLNLRYGLHFMFSDRCSYAGNQFVDNDAGVAVMYSKHVEMSNNQFESNRGTASYGLLLKEISDGRIIGNRFHANTVGLLADGSNRMTVQSNVFEANGWAVKIMANSEQNIFSENDFLRNTFDVSTNSRQSYSTFRGNYWDRYGGYDLDGDGVGDVPFRPVRLFSILVEQIEPALILLRSPFVALLDAAEAVIPALTPQTLTDDEPRMQRST